MRALFLFGLCAFYLPIILGLIYTATTSPPEFMAGIEREWIGGVSFLATLSAYHFGRLLEYVNHILPVAPPPTEGEA